MSDPMAGRDQLKRALWHSRECGKAIRRACVSLGVDPDGDDEPVEDGLAPLPPDDDIDFPDHVEPTTPFDPAIDNPQSRYLRLVRGF
jgi:hypothetical protein